MKKLLRSLALLMILLLLTACGEKAGTPAEPSAAPTETGTVTASPEGTETSAPAGTETDAPSTEPAATPTPNLPTAVTVAALKGPTALGMLPLMKEYSDVDSAISYDFPIFATADQITAKLITGEISMAAVPCNLAATLYQKSEGKICIAAVNTLGVLSILETGDSISAISDLAEKTIYTTGAGTTPEWTLRHVLSAAGIDPDKDVTIEFLPEATAVAAKMEAADKDIVAMLPEPYATSVLLTNANARRMFGIEDLWGQVLPNTSPVTGVLAVNRAFAEAYPETLATFLSDYKKSIENAVANPAELGALAESMDLFKAKLIEKALPNCSLAFLEGDEMKAQVSAYLEVLLSEDPKSVGGKLPDDAFYYYR